MQILEYDIRGVLRRPFLIYAKRDHKLFMKWKINTRFGLLMSKYLRKSLLIMNLAHVDPTIWHWGCCSAAIFNVCKQRRRRGRPLCLRLFLEMPYPYLSPCQMAKTCHNLHTQRVLWRIPSQLIEAICERSLAFLGLVKWRLLCSQH